VWTLTEGNFGAETNSHSVGQGRFFFYLHQHCLMLITDGGAKYYEPSYKVITTSGNDCSDVAVC